MLCWKCQLNPDNLPGAEPILSLMPSDADPPRRWRHCRRCGGVLQGADFSETFRRKLAQLKRFGLTEDGCPLLERTRPWTTTRPPKS